VEPFRPDRQWYETYWQPPTPDNDRLRVPAPSPKTWQVTSAFVSMALVFMIAVWLR
jgi:hypothetical protein